MNKTRSPCICFEEFLNQKPFESNFQSLAAQKPFPIFISFFLFCFGLLVFLLLSFWLISYSQPYFFIGPVSSSAQPCIQPTDPIFFSHLRPLDVGSRLWNLRPPCRTSLHRLPPAPWSHLASSPSSPLKMATPYHLPFPSSISCTGAIEVSPPLPPYP
jgi:hypothetical protein